MQHIRKLMAILILTLAGWYVVTYSGQEIAGPFTLLTDCNAEAAHLAARYYNVSPICQSR
jgi:hypothetical protein